MGIVQEKFQVEFPEKSQSDAWVSDESARIRKSPAGMLNRLPPGMDIADQDQSHQPAFRTGFPSDNDVTPDNSAMALKQGFTRKPMRPTDDMYTREHNDAFYDEVKVDGVTGFAERNNYLDRE